MKYWVLFAICLSLPAFNAKSQQVSKKRVALVAGVNALTITSSLVAAQTVWYSQFPKTSFHTFDDRGEWGNMDKLGHAYSAYQLTNLQFQTWRWTGLDTNQSLVISSALVWSYQFSYELLDAYNEQWGFSWSDIGANTLGVGLFAAQEKIFQDQYFHLKFGYKPTSFPELRPNVLGSTFPEKLLKDYNAQSYWLSVAPMALFGHGRAPLQWLEIAVGRSVDEQLYGNNMSVVIDNRLYRSSKEWALGLDIDWTQLPVKNKRLKNYLRYLNAIKLPLPAIYWRNGNCYVGLF